MRVVERCRMAHPTQLGHWESRDEFPIVATLRPLVIRLSRSESSYDNWKVEVFDSAV